MKSVQVSLVIGDHTIASALSVVSACSGDKLEALSIGMTMAAVLAKIAGAPNEEALKLFSTALHAADEFADQQIAGMKKAQH